MKPVDNKLIFNGLTYKLVLDEPEPAPECKPTPGLYYEFSDFPNFHPARTRKYAGASENENYHFNAEGTNWKHCRPIQDPNLIQMIPHDGGDCPVLNDTNVLVRFRNGATANYTAGEFSWSHTNNPRDIMFYAVLK
jgi:hypothetical protein